MAVTNTTQKQSFTGLGTTGPYAVTFPVTLDNAGDAEDLKVSVRDVNGAETDITSTSTITGKNITTAAAYDATNTIIVTREPALTQPSEYSYGQSFPAEQFEGDLDRIVFQIQMLNEKIGRSLKFPLTDTITDGEINNETQRADRVLGFDSSGNPQMVTSLGSGIVVTPFAETLVDDADAATARATLGVNSTSEIDTKIQAIYENRKPLGELFFLADDKAPAEYSASTPEDHFPAFCLSTIDGGVATLDATNWPDLVPYLRGIVLTYLKGKTGEKSSFDVTNWDITSTTATLTLANTTAENAILAALAEDNLVNGSYSNWRTVTLATAIGNISAGTYAITDVDPLARTIEFTTADTAGSGSVTATVSFYAYRIAGSTTTARVWERSAGALIAAGDADGEAIAGLRRRDRMQGHDWYLYKSGGGSSQLVSNGEQTASTDGNYASEENYQIATNNSLAADRGKTNGGITTDGTNGTPRTGSTTDPRAMGAHLFVWGKSYVAP